MNINKIIVFGSKGMLGNYIKTYLLNKKFEVIEINREKYDVLKDSYEKLDTIFGENKVNEKTLIFNGIGMIPHAINNSTNNSISNKDNYYKINGEFPQKLNEIRKKYGAKMIHPTTDCVYSGGKGNYNELDKHDAEDDYGKSKSLGELNNDCTIIRTSIIGEEIYNKRSLIEWVKKNKDNEINGFDNHIWNGITCLQFAKIVYKMIKDCIFWSGVRHFFSPENVTKYQLIKLVNEVYNLNIKINKYNTQQDKNMTISSIYKIEYIIPKLENQIEELKKFKLY